MGLPYGKANDVCFPPLREQRKAIKRPPFEQGQILHKAFLEMQDEAFNLRPEWGLANAPAMPHKLPIIGDEFHDLLVSGTVTLVAGVSRVLDSHVELTDGKKLEVDAIIFAIGYNKSFSLLGPYDPSRHMPQAWKDARGSMGRPLARLYQGIFSLDFPDSLAYSETVGPTLSASINADLASMALAQVWLGASKLPSAREMAKSADTQNQMVISLAKEAEIFDPAIVNTTEWTIWADRAAGLGIQDRIGYGWKSWWLWLTDYRLYKTLLDGKFVPQYSLLNNTTMAFLRSYFTTKPALLEKDVTDLKGKVFIITGGTGGIGLELAKILYHANATRIYILSRSAQSGDTAIGLIKTSEAPPGMKQRSAKDEDTVRFIALDLGDFSSIKAAAESFLKLETRLDVIWHNAAVMLAPEGSVSKQGHELTFATNVFGPFLFQHFLTPIMLQTSRNTATVKGSVRVCWAGSGDSVVPPGEDGILWDDWKLSSPEFGGFKGRTMRYMQSKAGNAILAAEMAKLHPDITSCAFNPGAIRTDIARHAPWFLQAFHNLMAHPVRFGALTELYAGFSDEVAKKNGCFVVPFGQIGSTVPKVEAGIAERNTGKRLWDLCDEHVRDYY
ncbi:hypothetical protein N5P37_006703 [Trichoderma harzianum]|nr:hypothetical protein N5P37_006703 [Trichoderma harzianum]